MSGLRRRKITVGDVSPDMNVTPLVDVVLVLLIIFMVVAPRLEQDVQIDLPGIFNPDPDVKLASDPLKLTVAKHGEYHIDQQQYDLDGATLNQSRTLIATVHNEKGYGSLRVFYLPTPTPFPLYPPPPGVINVNQIQGDTLVYSVSNATTPGITYSFTVPPPNDKMARNAEAITTRLLDGAMKRLRRAGCAKAGRSKTKHQEER